MFIEKRKSGKSIKYYLVHSFREGKKVIKLRRYLGREISQEKRKQAELAILDQLKNYKEIRDPLQTILSDQELRQIENLENKIDFKIHHLNHKHWLRFSELFSYNTNAIEGSTLTLREVRNILEEKKLPNKSKDDIFEAKGVAKAIDHIRSTKAHLSLELLKKLHYLTFKDTKSFAGKFRGKGIEVVIRDKEGDIIHQGAPSKHIAYLLKELVNWYNKNKDKYSPVLLAAVIHNQFENIHPFQDGNGRVGRLLLNNILLRHNMPPVDIEFNNRQEYYLALQIYQREGNIRPMIELIIKEYNKLKKAL